MAKRYIEARERVANLRRNVNLLAAADRLGDRKYLLESAVGEVGELEKELNKDGTEQYSPKDTAHEFNDIIVFYNSWVEQYYPQLDSTTKLHGANGYGRHSAALEDLKPVILDTLDDPFRAIPEVTARLYSIETHLPIPHAALGTLPETLRKVTTNRPPELYSTFCPILGRELTDDEAMQKFLHLEKGTRLLRQHSQKGILEPALWQKVAYPLLDWQHSEQQLLFLKEYVENGGTHG